MNKYQNLSKEQLLQIVEKQEKELKNKKYGLVWDSEREPEQVVLDCENNLPVLKRVKGKEIRTNDDEDNILIEGDNYHALTVLNYTHKEKIDVIYIDPPYNTGAKDWKYNNNFIDENDGYRHSKWLNMMSKRLIISRKLLSQGGIICVTIDDYEFANLKIVLDQIFGLENFLGTIVIRNNPAGRSTRNEISITHEYALFYGTDQYSQVCRLNRSQNQIERYDQEDSTGKFEWVNFRKPGSLKSESPPMFYPIFANSKSIRIPNLEWNSDLKKWDLLEEPIGDEQVILPIDEGGKERRWRWGIERVKANIAEFIPKWQKDKLHIYVKGRMTFEQVLPMTWWDKKEYSSTAYGANLLKDIFSELQVFSYPKSIHAVVDCIRIMNNKKDAIILDFFAGSGTTGHAVLELNKEDGGNRKFILCTNNENNICTDVTYPRIEKVINGYDFKGKDKTTLFEKKITWTDFSKKAEEINKQINTIIEENSDKYDKIEKKIEDGILKVTSIKNIDGKKEGLGGNLQYFKTSFVKKTSNRDQVKLNLTRKCTEMLCVKENIFNEEKTEEDFIIFSSNKKDKFLCVYYNFIDDSFEQFIAELKKLKTKKIIYMFSLENKIEKSLFKGINNFTLEPIPQKILDVYKQLVKMNIPEKKEIIFIELGKANKKIFEENEKDESARILRIVLEKTIQKIAQNTGINILNDKGKEEKISTLNDLLKGNKTFSQIVWEENKTCLAIGNHAAHGEYDEYEIKQVKHFYKHVQSLLDNFI